MNKFWKSSIALLLCLVLALGGSVVRAAEKAPEWMYEIESGEKVDKLIKEDEETWAPVGPVPAEAAALEVGGKSAVLMDVAGGNILFEKNSHEKLPIASVTKIMTLLLVMEAIENGMITYDDNVTCSSTAASMGGSQIWLEEGEVMTVRELLKAAAVVSANDACAALAEYVSGSIEGFVAQMNARAAELGMNDTKFLDCSGLSDDAYSSAHDVALMSRALIQHKDITQFTTIWMDTLRDGKSQLVNTNKLVRHYAGATGLKTGTTQKAGHCLSATAERGGMGMIAVILGCTTTDERFGGARKMLDYGFANYAVYTPEVDPAQLRPVKVLHGLTAEVETLLDPPQPLLIRKGQEKNVTTTMELAEDVEAPVIKGQLLGQLRLMLDGKQVAEYPIRAAEEVPRMTFSAALGQLLRALLA